MSGEELEKKQTKGDSVWTESSGVPVPQEPDGGILKPKKVVKKGMGGALGALAGLGGGKNAGFALGVLPGLLYRDKYKRDEEEKAGQEAAAAMQAKQAAAQAGAAAPSAGGMKKGGMTASKRADGIASKGKTRGKIC
jgi:hypothetical protein